MVFSCASLAVTLKLEEPVTRAEHQHEDQGDQKAPEAGANVANVHLAHTWDCHGGVQGSLSWPAAK